MLAPPIADDDTAGTARRPIAQSDEPAFLRKLGGEIVPTPVERSALLKVLGANVRFLRGRTALVEHGTVPHEVHVVLEGWACRTRSDGRRRQIVAFYVPGDICEPHALLLGAFDETISAVNGLRVAGIGRTTYAVLHGGCAPFAQALQRQALTAAAIQRRWTVNVARRGARERLAHLICELVTRLDAVGLNDGNAYAWPISQADIADACGVTVEHANRVLQSFRAEGLISLADQILVVRNREDLISIAGFDGGYLDRR